MSRLRYQGRQYSAGKFARGGGSDGLHMLEQAANLIEELQAKVDAQPQQREAVQPEEDAFEAARRLSNVSPQDFVRGAQWANQQRSKK